MGGSVPVSRVTSATAAREKICRISMTSVTLFLYFMERCHEVNSARTVRGKIITDEEIFVEKIVYKEILNEVVLWICCYVVNNIYSKPCSLQ